LVCVRPPARVPDRSIRADFACLMIALALATVCILIRSIFRVAELSEGFNGPLANQQVTFMVLEGAMVVFAAVSITIFHPGLAMQGAWKEADFKVCCCGGRRRRRGEERAAVRGAREKETQGAVL